MGLVRNILACSTCFCLAALVATAAYAIPIDSEDEWKPPPGYFKNRPVTNSNNTQPLANLPRTGERFLFPSINADPRLKQRNDQLLRAAIERREGKVEQAAERLEGMGLNQAAPKNTYNTVPTAEETLTQQLKQQQQLQAQQEAFQKEQERLAKEQHQQELQQYLFNAIQKGHVEWVEHALKNGAKVNMPLGGYLPVQFAVASRQLDVARYLIEKGAAFGDKKNAYFTLFHQAAYAGNTKLIELLLLKKADPHAPDSEGKQAWEYARNPQIREFLISSRRDAAPGAPSGSYAVTTTPADSTTQAEPVPDEELFPDTLPAAAPPAAQ